MSATPLHPPDVGRRLYGLLLVAAGSVLWSTAGLFVRVLDLDLWSIQLWRSLFAGASLLLVVFAEHRWRAPQAIRAIGLYRSIQVVHFGSHLDCGFLTRGRRIEFQCHKARNARSLQSRRKVWGCKPRF